MKLLFPNAEVRPATKRAVFCVNCAIEFFVPMGEDPRGTFVGSVVVGEKRFSLNFCEKCTVAADALLAAGLFPGTKR